MHPLTQTIPLFPLDMVLFPGMMLPLHIFEPRYRKMVQDCVAKELPFGLVWAEEEPLALPEEQPLIGTLAKITDVEQLEDGRFNINTVGIERFRVRSLSYDEPYLVGTVEPSPARDGASGAALRQRAPLERLLARYIALLNKIADNEIRQQDIPDDAATLGYMVAVYYQCQNWRKQELLAINSIPDLMEREIELLRVEIPIIENTLHLMAHGNIPPLIVHSLAAFGLN